MIWLWIRWLKIGIINFPQYEYAKSTKVIVFLKTGHALSFSNPYGLPEKMLKALQKIQSKQTFRQVLFSEVAVDTILLSMSERDPLVI